MSNARYPTQFRLTCNDVTIAPDLTWHKRLVLLLTTRRLFYFCRVCNARPPPVCSSIGLERNGGKWLPNNNDDYDD